jgi:putative spermidine/putrescine transport system substrate-binding protein
MTWRGRSVAGRGRLSRRAAVRGMAGCGLLIVFGGCSDDGEGAAPTETPTPSEAAPTATQPPITSPVPGYGNPRRWAGRTLTVASLGGEYQDAQEEAIFAPFAEATAVEVRTKLMDLGELRQQVENRAVTWDVVDIPTDEVLPLAHADYLTPIDYQVVDRTPLFDEVAMQYAVGAAFFSTVIAYAAAAPRPPSGWADFWDVEAFEGSRALRHGPIGTLEFALLADGVALADLYPLDVERAFASLDRIRPYVAQWYDNTKQPVALIQNGDVAMASTYSVRAETPDARPTVRLRWNGGMLSADSWVVPRGAPNQDVAMDFIAYATRAVPAANFSRLVPFGPVNKQAFSLLRPDLAAALPNGEAHRAVQFVQNWNWWTDNRQDLTDRFSAWLLADPAPTQPAP